MMALNGIAIVGMAGRFPGARNVKQFWENQCAGVESISQFTVEELEVPNATRLAQDPRFVRARSVVDDAEMFDAAFFGVYPKEAELMDPQQRVFLECCYQALEDAGYDPFDCPGLVGVYAGCAPSTYFVRNICGEAGFTEEFVNGYQVGNYQHLLGNNVDFLATRVAYKLNLKGPAFTMVAGCSTSLLTVCQACQSLETFSCDLALAGGVSITFPQKRGYMYQEGGMVSPDGHCRAFDANANGTVFGSGAGVVALKRLEDALADKDHIYAVIRGYAINNDGASKVGYTAPSVEGQAQVIAMAHAAAEVAPETITYVEAHGTGTPLGDPIEIAALTQAFRAKTQARQFCALGSVKTNVGHLDIAAGVTGLINASLAVTHGLLPPTLHFQSPNPKLHLDESPFYVSNQLREWICSGPRRAGVSAFGVGGTNAHVVIEEAPEQLPEPSTLPAHLLILSAKSESSVDQMCCDLAAHLENAEIDLANVAFTLQQGRHHFQHRRAVAATSVEEVVKALRSGNSKTQFSNPQAAFMFPGQGSQYPNMGRGLYDNVRVYREEINRCTDLLSPILGFNLRDVLYPAAPSGEASERLKQTRAAQPAIFAVEYALAKLWMEWGITPTAMVGHSIGEFVAACLAGVFTLEDALSMVAARGQLMQSVAPGAMLSVRAPESKIAERLRWPLCLAASNGPSLCVVSGPFDAIGDFERQLSADGIVFRRLVTSHAFHSSMMDSILPSFAEHVAKVELNAPKIPYVSTVTAQWITEEQAVDPQYWITHLRRTVRFSDSVVELMKEPELALLEVGPGNTLSVLARQHLPQTGERTVISSMPDASQSEVDFRTALTALGSLWSIGMKPKWETLYESEQRQRISLPTYCFDRKRYWIDNRTMPNQKQATATKFMPQPEVAQQATADKIGESNVSSQSVQSNNRRTRLQTKLADIFEELSGVNLSSEDPSASFLELGFDSLLLTQVTQEIQKQLGLKITFRQLLDSESTLEALAAFADKGLPPEAFAEQPTRVNTQTTAAPLILPQLPSLGTGTGGESLVERVVREQLQAMSQLMTQQLQMLSAAGAVTAIPSPGVTSGAPNALAATVAEAPAKSETCKIAQDGKHEEFKPFGPYKPIQRGSTDTLTPEQERYLQKLITEYTEKTAKSKAMTQDSRDVLADPRVAAGFRSQWKDLVYPIVTERSKGSKLWDIDGNEYVDILNGFGPIMLGHAPDFVTKAVSEQLSAGFEIGPQSPLAGKVAELICEFTGMERATFCNTGSEAVMAAIRLARTVTGRDRVVTFTGDYHGAFDEVLVKGVKRGGNWSAVPIAPGIPHSKAENITVLEYGSDEALSWIETHASELAAVLVEPVQSRHMHLQPKEFLKKVREITERSDTALVFDEVVTGFRVHPGGAQAVFGVKADIATYGKVLGGGMPIGAIAGKRKYMDALDGGTWQYGDDSFPSVGVTFFAGTFVRHPLALAAAQAVLLHLKEQGPHLQEKLNARTAALVTELNDFLEERQAPTRIGTFGSAFYFAFPTDLKFATLFYYHMRLKGVHILEGFPCFLTTTHTDEDLALVKNAFKESILEMQEAGVLPGADAKLTSSTAASEPVLAPMTESQIEILMSAQMGTDASCAFNESVTLRLEGPLNEDALRKSVSDLITRHEILRATFKPESMEMVLSPTLDLEIPLCDLSSLDGADQEQRWNQMLDAEARTPFDLLNGPMLRAQIVRFAPAHHRLLMTGHHIACDGWSTNVLLSELGLLYSARLDSEKAELSKPLPFSEYAKQVAADRQSDRQEEAEMYWLAQFAKTPPQLDLPTDRPRPAVKSYSGATLRKKIDRNLFSKLRSAGARQGCTSFATLLAAFQVMLFRLARQEDIVVGIPAAGQSLLDGQTLVGHCVTFLPLRSYPSREVRFSDFLKASRKTLLDAYEHQTYTYGSLVRKLGLKRDPSRLPLVEVQFNLEKVGVGVEFKGLSCEVDSNPKAFVNFDIFFNIRESSDGLTIDCDYNTDLFDPSTMARHLDRYEEMLADLAENISQPLSNIPVLSPAERVLMLEEWNATTAEYPEACVHELVDLQAAKTPKRIAIVCGERQMSYADLCASSSRLASRLVQQGVRRGMLVGICMERSIEMVVAALGVMRAGAAYIPLDPMYPQQRTDFILDETAATVLLTQSHLAKDLVKRSAAVIVLDDLATLNSETIDGTSLKSGPDDLAYVIYTSGSTGRPKGVEITHRAYVNLLTSMQQRPGITESDTLLAVTTFSFDIAGLELFLPLISGAKLVIASRETAADGSALKNCMAKHQITIMQATPITWRLLLEAGWDGNPSLKVLVGGEAVPRDLVNKLAPAVESVWNMYGPTETTIWSSTRRLESGEGPVLVGGPINNTQFYVLDSDLQPCPIGVAGELHIGGVGLARGYHKRPQHTAERFITSPFNAGERLYKTGDLVRCDTNGGLNFLGRMDHQVKIRGYRVELGEIETALATVPGVKRCAAMVREDVAGEKRLVAYLVAGDKLPPHADMRAMLLGQLPDYMVPVAFVELTEMPLTPNGKIDRQALPAPGFSQSTRSRAIVEPRNEHETKLVKIWSEVLHLETISVEDSLFELGADSLHIFQIVARANQAGIAISPKHLMQHRTIAAVVAEVGNQTSGGTSRVTAASREKYRVKGTGL